LIISLLWKQSHDGGQIAPICTDSRKGIRKARKKKELFGDINDPDLKRELARGQTRLISYTES
jgi:hypothetical protein